jgi:nitrite reductase (NO-forming)
MIDAAALRRRATPVDRSSDRQIALAAMAVAVSFMAAAILSTLLPESTRRGLWLPVHLALTGAASTAIAGVMPFFSAAIAAAPPSDARLRSGAVAAVALGALGVSAGVVTALAWLAAASGTLFIAGIGLVGVATVRPLRSALGPRRGIVTRGYVAALAHVAVGASLATLLFLGWAPVTEAWPRVRVAHAWLNVVGFVSLVIASTLLHFFPTVVGARIAAHPSAKAAVAGLGLGAPLVATGVVLGSDLLARSGALLAITGCAALTLYAWRVWSSKARWTTDPHWHRFATVGLVSAIGWLDVGVAGAAVPVLLAGASPAAWSAATVAGPLIAGWAGLALVASVTHLVPAVGPGGSAAHARQRQVLGRLAIGRLALINLGVFGITAGLWLGVAPVAAAGLAAAGLGYALTIILMARGLAIGRSEVRTPRATTAA